MAAALLIGGGGILSQLGPFPKPFAGRALGISAEPATTAVGVSAGASRNAFGRSRQVRILTSLPGRGVEFPLEVSGDPAQLRYQWVSLRDGGATEPRPLVGALFEAPANPGFYRMAVLRDDKRRVLDAPVLGVMTPFSDKVGASLNGYRIGTYLSERVRGGHDRPDGFLEVHEEDLEIEVSRHLRLGDFVTRDNQAHVWPKYVALDTRLLDKIELVIARLDGGGSRIPPGANVHVALNVQSGFRTPAHNARIFRAARDSRHQYGDAADIAIDADGDGRITRNDEILVQRAVDAVEAEHPDLVGGLGIYPTRGWRPGYVHIDARGRRSRWRG